MGDLEFAGRRAREEAEATTTKLMALVAEYKKYKDEMEATLANLSTAGQQQDAAAAALTVRTPGRAWAPLLSFR